MKWRTFKGSDSAEEGRGGESGWGEGGKSTD